MNDMPFWISVVLAVILTAVAGAYLLPLAEGIYRRENWLATWPLREPERAERRDAFEVQLATFLERERRLGYRPIESGVRLFVRMLSTLLVDSWDGSRAVGVYLFWFAARLLIMYRLWALQRLLKGIQTRAEHSAGVVTAAAELVATSGLVAETSPRTDQDPPVAQPPVMPRRPQDPWRAAQVYYARGQTRARIISPPFR